MLCLTTDLGCHHFRPCFILSIHHIITIAKLHLPLCPHYLYVLYLLLAATLQEDFQENVVFKEKVEIFLWGWYFFRAIYL